ncbi:MAG: tripartite tricarboxylate transporter substrate-binding protein [Negativicutes bacterium]
MKKVWAILALVMLVAGVLAGCGGKEAAPKVDSKAAAPKVNYPTKPITIIVSFSAGGGTDLGARALIPYLEKELGVPVVIENKPGANGWIGYSELLKAKPDGYTLGYFNTPGLVQGDLNPSVKRAGYESFDYIANHVVDPAVIAVRADEKRFTNLKELAEYAKTHELTATSNGVGSSNHLAILTINDKLKIKIKPVQFGGASESLTAVLGGHIDLFTVKVGEILEPVREGQFKVLGVMMKERNPQLPDVPTFKEALGVEVINYTTRGIGAPKGLDPQVLAKLQKVVGDSMKNPEHVAKLKKMGLIVDGRVGEDYKKLVSEEEKSLRGLVYLLGWKK